MVVGGVEGANDGVVDLSHVVGRPDGGVFGGDVRREVLGEIKGGYEGVVVVCVFWGGERGVD